MKNCVDGSKTHNHCEELKDSKGLPVIVCHDCKQTLGRPCEVYARVVGYMRPVSGWNKGKQSEFSNRKSFLVPMPK